MALNLKSKIIEVIDTYFADGVDLTTELTTDLYKRVLQKLERELDLPSAESKDGKGLKAFRQELRRVFALAPERSPEKNGTLNYLRERRDRWFDCSGGLSPCECAEAFVKYLLDCDADYDDGTYDLGVSTFGEDIWYLLMCERMYGEEI